MLSIEQTEKPIMFQYTNVVCVILRTVYEVFILVGEEVGMCRFRVIYSWPTPIVSSRGDVSVPFL